VTRSAAIRLLAIAAAIVAIPALTGCAAGLNAQTTRPFDTTDGTSANFHGIAIRNMFVLGPAAGTALLPGQSASLFVALVNNGLPDQLTLATAPGTASAVTIRGGSVRLASGQAAFLTGPAPQLILRQLEIPLTGGQYIHITLYFQNSGSVVLHVPVVGRQNSFSTFLPPPSPVVVTPRATGTATRSPTPAAGSSGSTGSPTPTASPSTSP
jgi:hypothetical protein